MMQLFEQNHFGRLDPLTFGIWCNIDAVTEHPRSKLFGPLMIASFWEPPFEAHTRFIDELETEEEKALAYAAFSLFAHESRHFFDLMTTPYGVYLTRKALVLQFAYLFNMREIHGAPAIYVPFTEWTRNAELLAQLDSDLQHPPEAVSAFAELADKYHRDLRTLRYGSAPVGARPCAVQILEALAVLSQEACIRRYFGEAAVTIFRTWTRSRAAGSWYYGAIDYIRARAPDIDTDALALLLYLSLFAGPSTTELADASPGVMLEYLVDSVKGLFWPPGPTVPPQFAHFQMVLELAYAAFEKRQHKRPLRSVGDELGDAATVLETMRTGFEVIRTQPDLELTENLESARSPVKELLDYTAEILDLGAKMTAEVVFKRASNLRISYYCEAMYELPRALPYLESTFGFTTYGVLLDALSVLVGFELPPEALTVPGIEKYSYLKELKENVPAGMPFSFVVIATLKSDNRPPHAESALKLFKLLYLCRLATDGLPRFEPFAEGLLGQIWDNSIRVYAAGKRVGMNVLGIV
jgi:hypothetical protein